MKFFLVSLVCLTTSSAAADAVHEKGESADAPNIRSAEFGYLKKRLNGAWAGRYTNGTLENPSDWQPVKVNYRLTGNGSAIVENYFYEDDENAGMSTVYYPDDTDLRLTHYCGAQNHPRMKWKTFDEDSKTYGFEFIDITNLHDESDYHSRSLKLTFVSDDNIRIVYSGNVNGKTAVQTYDLFRRNGG